MRSAVIEKFEYTLEEAVLVDRVVLIWVEKKSKKKKVEEKK